MLVAIIIVLAIVAVVATVAAVRFKTLADTSRASAERFSSENNTLAQQADALRSQVSSLNIENGRLEERLSNLGNEITRLNKDAESRFNALAQTVLEEKAKTFKASNEARLDEILKPFRENVEALQRQINEKYVQEGKDRNLLSEHIKDLVAMNQTISKETRELTSALRGNSKVQGDWGEIILQTLLEKSGLIEGENFKVQVTRSDSGEVIRNDDGSLLRPDVVLLLPDGKKLVIDSKVSLTNYVNYVNADDDLDRDKYITLHEQSVKKHINELKTKRYQDYVQQSGSFVMMFIPNEGAFIAAMRSKANLLQYAYDSNVVLMSPSNLMATIQLVAQIWQHDKQTKNAINIAEESGKLYDKFVGFYEDMKKIGRNLEQTSQTYNSALNKLSDGTGNLITRVEKLREMGAKASKSLPQP